MLKHLFRNIIVYIIECEARLVLFKYKPNIVAITGSVGKTSTKDAIYTVLTSVFFVRKGEKSFNSEIGIPLIILGCSSGWSSLYKWSKNILEGLALIMLKNHYPKWLVLEVGADQPGDIKRIARWLKPDIVVLTRIPEVPVHVEFFESPQAVVEEKKELVRALKDDGVLILNGDDEHIRTLSVRSRQTLTYGFKSGLDFIATHEQPVYENGSLIGITFRVDYRGSSVPIKLHNVLGRQHVYPVLASFAVGSALGINMVNMAQLFESHNAPPGRMRILPGIRGSQIIDDSYNSSPVAVTEALNALNSLTISGRKIVVLGDMLELGDFSADEHRKAGVHAAAVADILITVGTHARGIAESARESGMSGDSIVQFDDARAAGNHLYDIVKAGDMVLIKGSQALRMERTVEAVMVHTERTEEVLVRQEKEWLAR